MFERPFFFVRHGETELNANRIVAGSIDTDLTPAGREQALKAAEVLARHPITGVFSSPLRRARDTALPIAAKLKLPVLTIPEIAERNWGSLEGQPRGSRLRGVVPEGAESTEQFTARVLSGFAQIDSEAPLIVGHSGVFRVIARTLGLVESKAPITNALPLRFDPLAGGGWALVPLTD